MVFGQKEKGYEDAGCVFGLQCIRTDGHHIHVHGIRSSRSKTVVDKVGRLLPNAHHQAPRHGEGPRRARRIS